MLSPFVVPHVICVRPPVVLTLDGASIQPVDAGVGAIVLDAEPLAIVTNELPTVGVGCVY